MQKYCRSSKVPLRSWQESYLDPSSPPPSLVHHHHHHNALIGCAAASAASIDQCETSRKRTAVTFESSSSSFFATALHQYIITIQSSRPSPTEQQSSSKASAKGNECRMRAVQVTLQSSLNFTPNGKSKYCQNIVPDDPAKMLPAFISLT